MIGWLGWIESVGPHGFHAAGSLCEEITAQRKAQRIDGIDRSPKAHFSIREIAETADGRRFKPFLRLGGKTSVFNEKTPLNSVPFPKLLTSEFLSTFSFDSGGVRVESARKSSSQMVSTWL
jgi:hypothetical protein